MPSTLRMWDLGKIGDFWGYISSLFSRKTDTEAKDDQIRSSVAVLLTGDTNNSGNDIADGTLIQLRGHTTLADGAYAANGAILENASLTSSNLTALTGGIGNFLQDGTYKKAQVYTKSEVNTKAEVDAKDEAVLETVASPILGDDNDTGAAIAEGTYVQLRGHATLADGLYITTAAIASLEAITSSNVSAVPGGMGGALTSLNSKIDNLLKSKTISGTTDANGYISLGLSQYQVPVYATGTNQARIQRFVCGMNSGLWGGYALCDVKSTSVTFTCWYLDFSIIL